MNRWLVCCICLLFGATLVWGEARREALQLDPATAAVTVTGSIKGHQGADYQVCGRAGQVLTVDFRPDNAAAYFNLLPPGGDQALFIGSTSGSRSTTVLPADGCYTLRVYLMRSAARRQESSRYTLAVRLVAPDATIAPKTFDQTLELYGIRFRVSCANRGSLNTLHIVPAGLDLDNAPLVREIEGFVSGAEVADLDADHSPEIYVYVTSAGSGSYGSLVAYAANRRKSLSQIYLPPLTDDKQLSRGYRGHDQFAVLEGVLGRRFPVYRDTDSNATSSGGTRQLQYRLLPGEAGWVLRLDKVLEY